MFPEEQEHIELLASGLRFPRFSTIALEELIDCGDFGCVFLTNQPGIVVKIGRQWSEYQFARVIIEKNLQHPGLPRIYEAINLQEALGAPYYAIIREDIPDLVGVDMSWLDEILADLDYQTEDADNSDDILDIAVEILAARPGIPSDELLFEKVAELTAWCYDQGILLGDTLAANFGQTIPGTIKIRDLGGTRFLSSGPLAGQWLDFLRNFPTSNC